MGSLLSQASALLVLKGVGSISGAWPIKISRLTITPDAQLALYLTPGQTPNPKWLLDFPTFQVMVRGAVDDFVGAETKAQQVKDALLGIEPYVHTGGDRWNGVTMLGDFAFLRYDDNSRPLFSGNFRVIKEPVATVASSREAL